MDAELEQTLYTLTKTAAMNFVKGISKAKPKIKTHVPARIAPKRAPAASPGLLQQLGGAASTQFGRIPYRKSLLAAGLIGYGGNRFGNYLSDVTDGPPPIQGDASARALEMERRRALSPVGK